MALAIGVSCMTHVGIQIWLHVLHLHADAKVRGASKVPHDVTQVKDVDGAGLLASSL